MSVLFDHLTAVLVGATLLVGLLVVQVRGRQAAIEATVRHQAETHTAQFLDTFQRDLENARTARQARTALGTYQADHLGGSGERALDLQGTDALTERVGFVTLADPAAGQDSRLVAVTYRLEPTGAQALVEGTARPLHRIVRYEATKKDGWQARGGSTGNIVGFRVRAVEADGDVTVNGRMADLPAQATVELLAVAAGPTQRAGDQRTTMAVGVTRQGASVRLVAAGSTGSLLPPRQDGAPGIPRPPGTLPPPPPPPPPPPTTTRPPSGGDGSPTPNRGTPTPKPPKEKPAPLPPRPTSGQAV